MDNTKKIIVWGINAILFVAVVYMGITQAGQGAEISVLDDQMIALVEEKHNLSEKILLGNSTTSVSEKSESLGFAKPENIVYIDSKDLYASLLVR